ncbi:YfjI family protein [Bacteroides thetaiotaomicron]|nr:YfjI family protein [Bacteroides thetaiotaomicron]
MLAEVVLEGNDDLQAVVKRYACLVMRISMIQARIRQFEANDGAPDIYCEDVDFDRSLQIVLCCYEHSRLLLSSMPSSQAPSVERSEQYTEVHQRVAGNIHYRRCNADRRKIRFQPPQDQQADKIVHWRQNQ